ncbi:MAG: sulfotransferase [Gallionellaceae bacterium]|nr:sulfotransferase [Gallionellaceae bacterium]
MNKQPAKSHLPDFIIIGAMKSATSSLYQQLVRQPGIFMCTPKEPNFFSDADQYAKGMAWYEGLFAHAPEGSLLGEASTHYTKLPTYPQTIERLKKYLPDVRLVYVMRHPVDRLVSHYMHEWSTGVYNCDISEAITKYPELIAYGRYAMQLEPYFEIFGRDAVLPVFFDRFIREPQAELERVCRFIGYRGQTSWASNIMPDNVSSERIRKFPGYKLLVESAAATWLRRNFIPQNLRDVIKMKLRMGQRPSLNEADRRCLEAEFDHDLVRLGEWLGTSLNCRNFKQLTAATSLDWIPC